MHRLWMTLLELVVLVLFAGRAGAQDVPEMRVELGSGRVLHGTIDSIDAERIVVRTPTGTLAVRISNVASILPVSRTDDEAAAPGVRTPPSPDPVAVDATTPSPDRELLRFAAKYLWFLPSTDGHRSTIGAAALVALVLLVQLAGRMANLENRSLGRSAAFASVVLTMLILELTFVPVSPFLIAGVLVIDVGTWFALGMLVFRADLFQGLVLLASFLLSALVLMLLLQIAGVLVHADQLLG